MKKCCLLVIAILLAAFSGAFADEPGRGMSAVPEDPVQPLKTGRQFLVVIGIGKYDNWMPLPDAAKDAREVRDILVGRYRIDERRELYDGQATKAAIIKLLEGLQKELKPDDSLLILYSGHGHLDRKSDTGFWIPVNAGTDVYEQLNWLPHIQLRGLISRMASTHVLVVSDSCFAGDLLYSTRDLPDPPDSQYLQKAYSLVSRLVLTSGATEPVPAASAFAAQLKSALKRNEEPFLDSLVLYNEVRMGMRSTIPLLGALPGAGHQEGASFLLFLRERKEKPAGDGPAAGAANPGNGWDSTLWVGGGLEAFLPLLELSNQFSVGPALVSHAIYTLRTPVGTFGAAIQAGAAGLSTTSQAMNDYVLLSFPVAVSLRYQAALRSPFFLSIDVAAGMAFSEVLPREPGAQGSSNLNPYISPTICIGQELSENVRISVGLGCALIAFSRPLLVACPILRFEYGLFTPKP
jgi:hypothetical protein